jgi:DNA polymerase III subunit gamma/tau
MSVQTAIEAYVPLYRKYRPATFADLCDQDMVTQTLCNAITLKKVAHAYLFCGPRGTGKTSAARIFAKSLNCEQGPTTTPCLVCASCTGVAQGQALDIIEFDAASKGGVDDARELIESCQYRSMSGRFKVYIIDEVHMLSNQAFNALLKTLEEPPENVIFIFATTEAHKVLPTIVSRCQRFDFSRITVPAIVERLRHVAGAESIVISDDALLLIARNARGGLRDAVGLLDQVSVLGKAYAGKVIEPDDVAIFTGTLHEALLLTLSGAIAQKQPEQLLTELAKLIDQGVQPVQILKELTQHFRNLLMVQAMGNALMPEILALTPACCEALKEHLCHFEEDGVLPQILSGLASVERNIRNSSNPYLWLEVGLLDLAYRQDIHLVKALATQVEQLALQVEQLQSVTTLPAITSPVVVHTTSSPQPVMATPACQPVKPDFAKPQPVTPQSDMQAKTQAGRSDQMPDKAIVPASLSKPDSAQPVTMQTTPVKQNPVTPIHQPVVPPALSELQQLHAEICKAIPSLPYRNLLQQQTKLIEQTETHIAIGCVGEVNLAKVNDREKMVHLKQAIHKVTGKTLTVELVLLQPRTSGHQEESSVESFSVESSGSSPVSQPVVVDTPVVVASQPVQQQAQPPEEEFHKEEPSIEESREQPYIKKETDRFIQVSQPASSSAASVMALEASHNTDKTDQSENVLPLPLATSATFEQAELAESKKHALEVLQGRMLDKVVSPEEEVE